AWTDANEGLLERLRNRASKAKGGGKIIVAGTPESDSSSEFCNFYDAVKEGKEPRSAFFQWSGLEVSWKTDAEKKLHFDSLTPEQRQSIIFGNLSYRTGPCYDKPRLIGEDELRLQGIITARGHLAPRLIPELGIDPAGGHCLFAVILLVTDVETGISYALDEYAQPNQTCASVVPQIVRLIEKWGIRKSGGLLRCVLDYSGDKGAVGSIRAEFVRLFSEARLSCKIGGYGTIDASKLARKASIMKVNELTRNNKLYINKDRCKRLIKEFGRYLLDPKGEPPQRSKWKDSLDALKYPVVTPGGGRDLITHPELAQSSVFEALDWRDHLGNSIDYNDELGEFSDDDPFLRG
ncbi:MAG: hypothetical protein L0Y56_10240, partial [Nitrospira sp.]|nr:hypothetical protein [Nitrospira sp.]